MRDTPRSLPSSPHLVTIDDMRIRRARPTSRQHRRFRAAGLGAAALIGALVLAACGSGDASDATIEAATPALETPDPAGPPRPFLLGFSAAPAQLTEAGYRDALNLAARYGEVLLIQRAPAWRSFLPGAAIEPDFAAATQADQEALAELGLQLAYGLDVFDPAARGRLSGLPERYAGQDLENPDLRAAFLAQARFIALNYRPAYLALGVEVNAAFEANPDGYLAFADVYREAYEEVKAISPDTQVLVTFQYEQLLGLVPWEPPHAPRWELLADFTLDVVGLTTYPSFVYSVARKVPPEYYAQLTERTDRPIAFMSAGYASAAAREGLNSSTPAEQRRFLERLLTEAEELQAPLLIWFASRDLDFAQSAPLDLLSSIGLRTAGDEPKEAWPSWEAAATRPYERRIEAAPAVVPSG